MIGPVAIATCKEYRGLVQDDLHLIGALNRRGISAVLAIWNDAAIDWTSFSLVVIRSPWDYTQHHAEFLAWIEKLPRVHNPAAILRWNSHKRYLADLGSRGLPVVPTLFFEPEDTFEPPSFPYLVKPAVSSGARDTARYASGEETAAREHVHRLRTIGQTVLVQPYLSEVDAQGEISLVYLGGTYSHAVRRAAALMHGRWSIHDLDIAPKIQSHDATSQERALADEVMKHFPGLLYARVDLVQGSQGEKLILEVELTEPALFLEFCPGSVERLADCIVTALA